MVQITNIKLYTMAEELQEIPENNKELDIKMEEGAPEIAPKAIPKQPPAKPKPIYFTITPDGVKDYVTTVNETLSSRFVKNTLFNALNALLVPVFPEKEEE